MENFGMKLNTLKNEHLKDGIPPIVGCTYDRKNIDKESQYYLDDFKRSAEFVNFLSKKEEILKNNFKNSGEETYVISDISEKNKYSVDYYNCTGVVAVGIEKKTGQNVSFLSHQSPSFFVENKEERLKFKKDLIENIKKIKEQCVSGTVDIVIFGGQKEEVSVKVPDDNENKDFVFGRDDQDLSELIKKEFDVYKDSIRYLSFFISSEMGFLPVIISGPNENFEEEYHALGIYFDNKNRRLYLVRPKEDSENNESFLSGNLEVEKQIKRIQDKNIEKEKARTKEEEEKK